MPPRSMSPEQIQQRKQLGSRIRKARLESGTGLRQMARALGMSPAWLLTVENGDNGLDSVHLTAIAAYLGLPAGALLQPQQPGNTDAYHAPKQPVTRIDWQALYPGEEERARAHYEVDRIFQRIGAVQTSPLPQPSALSDRLGAEATNAPYQAFGVDASPGIFPRTIRHGMGETTLHVPPSRVVALDSSELQTALELGITPVGIVTGGAIGLSQQAAEATRSSSVVGTINSIDYQALAAAEPDLILANKTRHRDLHDSLAAIAPTIYGEHGAFAWQQNFALYAQALGREAQAATVIQAYEQRVGELNALLQPARPSISLIRVLTGSIRYYHRNNFAASVLNHLRFPRPPAQNIDDFALIDMDYTSLTANAPADLIIVGVDRPQDNQYAHQLRECPEWQALDAVQRGSVLYVDAAVWFGSTGYTGAHQILDDLSTYLEIPINA